MKRFVWRWLAVSSVLAAALAAQTRPQYGGTVRVAMREAPTSLAPSDRVQTESFAQRSLLMLMFDTLVTTDVSGHVQPSLATSWQASSDNRHWQFRLRRAVTFHDGTPTTADSVAASLRMANPSWNVATEGDAVVVSRDAPDPLLPSKLALPENAIAKRNSDGQPSGTGPFQIADWRPGKKLTLAANESYWGGRSFVDGIEIEMGMNFRDQANALEIGSLDVAEVAAEQAHRFMQDHRQVVSSPPEELLAIVFARDAASPDEKLLRQALALSIERTSMRSVLLQGVGQAAASILPNWMSGYAFLFSTDADLAAARRAREQVRAIPLWTMGYDSSDPLSRLLTERVALNAKDAGLSLRPTAATSADLRLVRIPLDSSDPWIALADLATQVGLPELRTQGGSIEDLYTAERSMLESERIIPLFHLPQSYAGSARLKDWTVRSDGTWSLSDAWLGSGRP